MVRNRRAVVVVLTVAMAVSGLALPAAAAGCQANGHEMRAIGQFGQGELVTGGEVWSTMAVSQSAEGTSEADPGPGVVARHMDLQMEAYCSEG